MASLLVFQWGYQAAEAGSGLTGHGGRFSDWVFGVTDR